MIYFDNASTTPLSSSVKEYLISILDDYGNPSSIHQMGDKTKNIIDIARKSVSNFIHAENERMILFTPSGSASNTLGIKGFYEANNDTDVFFSAISHKSIHLIMESESFQHCIKNKIPVDLVGKLDLNWLDNNLQKSSYNKHLVIISASDSEIGTMQDIKAIDKLCVKNNCVLYIDYTAQIPYFELDVQQLETQNLMIGFSGHKLHALKGVGVLYKRGNYELSPLIYGAQEQRLIGGTENVLGIASLGKAVSEYDYSSINRVNIMDLWNMIQENISDVYLVGTSIEERLPCNLYICFKNIEAESLLLLLDMDDICVSTGSACNSNSLNPSNSLVEIGLKPNDYFSCIRFSLPTKVSKEELCYVCERLKYHVENLRELTNLLG